MLPRRKRLRAAEVRGALRGRRYGSEYFSATVLPAARKSYAVVVSKKISPSAVARHRIRRRVYAALAGIAAQGTIVLFPKASVETISAEELAHDLVRLLSKISPTP